MDLFLEFVAENRCSVHVYELRKDCRIGESETLEAKPAKCRPYIMYDEEQEVLSK